MGMGGNSQFMAFQLAAATSVRAVFTATAARSESTPTGYVIADSVLLGAKSSLEDLGFEVDAVEGRRPARLVSAVRSLPLDGRPVIVHRH